MTNEEAVKLLLEHKQWLEEPPIINGTGRIQKLIEAVQMGAEALDKSRPKKPIACDKSWNGTTIYKCPVCDGLLGTKSFNEEQNQIGCARCLSAIDWSEVE